MNCECLQLPDVLRLEEFSQRLYDQLEVIDKTEWLTLKRCRICGQRWQFDIPDRLQVNLAIKLDDTIEWPAFDDRQLRIKHLIDIRGGVSDEGCIMQDCSNKALKSLAHCALHAFEYLGLRE